MIVVYLHIALADTLSKSGLAESRGAEVVVDEDESIAVTCCVASKLVSECQEGLLVTLRRINYNRATIPPIRDAPFLDRAVRNCGV